MNICMPKIIKAVVSAVMNATRLIPCEPCADPELPLIGEDEAAASDVVVDDMMGSWCQVIEA